MKSILSNVCSAYVGYILYTYIIDIKILIIYLIFKGIDEF